MESGERRIGGDGEITLQVDAAAGGRITSLRMRGHELLVPRTDDPLGWGSYPMAPFAGRLRDGQLLFGARRYDFARNMPPHAIHGTVFDRAWEWIGDDTLGIDLGSSWPWPGRAEQRFRVQGNELCMSLEIHAAERSFPASAGFHPWFRRDLGFGLPARLDFRPGFRYACDDGGIPTGALLAPGDGPWDDTFTGLAREPVIEWPGALRLELNSDHAHWVVYDQRPQALCVEPLTAPPNAVNGAAHLVEPYRPLRLEFRLRCAPSG